MKRTPLTLRSTIVVALFIVLPIPGSDAFCVRRALQSNDPPISQDPGPAQEQSKASSDALIEASKLSLAVVKLFNEGKYDEALPLAKRALQLRESLLGPDHEKVQDALLNLAEIYTATKKYGEAQKVIQRLVKTHEEKLGSEDAGVAILLDKLAYVAFMQRDTGKSEAASQRALAIREKVFGQDSKEFAKSLYSLAQFYRFTGKFEKAKPLYERAAILRRKLLGREHPDYLKTKDGYACLMYVSHQEEKLKPFEEMLGDVSDPAELRNRVLNGRALSLPKPLYSREARLARARGTVIIKVTIDELGRVIEASDMCGSNPLLVKSSLEAARLATFTPTKLSGQPVKVKGVITYNFVVMR